MKVTGGTVPGCGAEVGTQGCVDGGFGGGSVRDHRGARSVASRGRLARLVLIVIVVVNVTVGCPWQHILRHDDTHQQQHKSENY